MKTKKTFDAVGESRRWKEETSRILNSMDRTARIKYFEELRSDMRRRQNAAPTVCEDESEFRTPGTPTKS